MWLPFPSPKWLGREATPSPVGKREHLGTTPKGHPFGWVRMELCDIPIWACAVFKVQREKPRAPNSIFPILSFSFGLAVDPRQM